MACSQITTIQGMIFYWGEGGTERNREGAKRKEQSFMKCHTDDLL